MHLCPQAYLISRLAVQAMDDYILAREEGFKHMLDRTDHPLIPSHSIDFAMVRDVEPIGGHAWLVGRLEVRTIDS